MKKWQLTKRQRILSYIFQCVVTLMAFFNAIPIYASWTSAGQYDISWYKASQKEFIITTNKQFAGIAYLIDNGYTTFSGMTIKLDQDIDLSGNIWSTVNGTFSGKIDGQNHVIEGLHITLSGASYPNYGLFKKISNAEISNVTFKGTAELDYGEEMYKTETNMGVIGAQAFNTKFVNCRTYCDVTYSRLHTQGSYEYNVKIGGFIGHAENCTFAMCCQNGSFLFELGLSGTGNANTNGGAAYIGGLVGYDYNGQYQSCGVVSSGFKAHLAASKQNNDVSTCMGGIVGLANDHTTIDACYSNVNEFDTWLPRSTTGSPGRAKFAVGGIAGVANNFAYGSGHIFNCYSSCKSLNIRSQPVDFGGIAGRSDKDATARYKACFSPSDLYYNPSANVYRNSGYDGSTSFSQTQMTTNSFLNELNLYPSVNGLDYEWSFQSWSDFPVIAEPEPEPANKFKYTIIDEEKRTVSISKDPGTAYAGDLIIPSTTNINGKTYTVTEIGVWAFEDCTGLTSVTIPNSVTEIGIGAFYGCTGLTSVTIPNSVTEIGNGAFYGCTGLTSVTIPNSVTEIGNGAFYGCTGLTSVTIPNSVTTIGSGIFKDCTGLTSPVHNNKLFAFFPPKSDQSTYTIPQGIETICGSAFLGCKNLKSVTIPNSVTEIGDYAFLGCTGLKSMTIPNSVTEIGCGAFKNCTGLTSPVHNNKLFAFFPPESDQSTYTIPQGIETICGDAFLDCTGLTSVTIPISVTEIGGGTFQGCTGLTSVTIPNSVTEIGVWAFYDCTGLTSVIMGEKVGKIGESAFSGCTSLTNLYAWPTIPPKCYSDVFKNVPIANCTLYVKASAKSAYQSADTWKDFKKIEAAQAMSVSDVNCTWGMAKEQVISTQEGGYHICQDNETFVVLTKTDENMDEIYLAYKFNKDGKLCASTLSMPENNNTKRISDEFFAQYDSEITLEDGLEVKTEEENLIAVDISSTNNGGGNIITLGFSYYEPLEERNDCVDLGLSVRWATMNLDASKPSGVGGFYAFSETSTKSEYWRENYAYCNNNANQYIFDYTNPQINICGTRYDVATKKLGEGWKMPSLAEANELISKCTWEKETVDGVEVYRVTGPNGNSIILPIVGWKKQSKEYSTTQLHLGIGECLSKSSQSTYVLTTERSGQTYKGSIGQEWKAWGYNIRPVYTK